MAVITNPAGYLFSGQRVQSTGAAMDIRHCKNYGLLMYWASGQSAIFNLEGSPDTTAWMIDSTYTATATQTGTAQISKFYPYVRGNLVKSYTGTGGATSGTAMLWMHYSPGLI